MSDMITALEALTDRDPNRRDAAADTLGDLLRDTALDTDTAHLVVGRLISLAFNEPETKVRESALNSISEAFNHHRLPLDLVEPLAIAMPTMEPALLEHALYILGATHDPRARLLKVSSRAGRRRLPVAWRGAVRAEGRVRVADRAVVAHRLGRRQRVPVWCPARADHPDPPDHGPRPPAPR
ncbi:hypothetical protein [Streptacidiphilus rugosus]|uniref:hypothetical protein n=1 Tax=Streptacidiphilus rugosus TaxID=405783 RepID=UPI0018DBBF0E|nr:hypothetical protein [Streptacidiphilus rugosus]